jgi:hypothetical protein
MTRRLDLPQRLQCQLRRRQAADEHVIALPGGELVGAGAADEQVVAVSARELVIPVAADQHAGR